MIAIQTELNRMKENPGTRIDRVEYKFDQLKIERLEGTLNIGLNPAEQEQVENFQIGQRAGNRDAPAGNGRPALAKTQDSSLMLT